MEKVFLSLFAFSCLNDITWHRVWIYRNLKVIVCVHLFQSLNYSSNILLTDDLNRIVLSEWKSGLQLIVGLQMEIGWSLGQLHGTLWWYSYLVTKKLWNNVRFIRWWNNTCSDKIGVLAIFATLQFSRSILGAVFREIYKNVNMVKKAKF